MALETGKRVLALESTLIAHGMPYPDNLEFAQKIDLNFAGNFRKSTI